jgi:hypothetical protein
MLQRWDTPSVDLLYFPSFVESIVTPQVVPFRFAAPGPRTMLTLKLLVRQLNDAKFVGANSSPAVPFDWQFGSLAVSWKLWLCRTVIDVGGSGARIPVANILGTRAAPVDLTQQAGGFPSLGTNGFSIDSVAGGDGVDGELTFTGDITSAPLATLASIRGRYNAVAPMCDEEWTSLRARFASSPDCQRKKGTP